MCALNAESEKNKCMVKNIRMSITEVNDTLDSGDFDDHIAEGSDDDLGMDVDYDYDSNNSEGIIE